MDNTRPFWARKYGSDVKYSGFSNLTKQGYIGIGWPYAGDITQLDTLHEIEAILKQTTPPEEAKDAKKDAGVVHRFVNIAQENDLVACNDQEANRLYIGRLIGECIYDTRLHKHFHLLRKVEWIEPLWINLYAGVQQMLDLQGVFWEISNPENLVSIYTRIRTRTKRTEGINE